MTNKPENAYWNISSGTHTYMATAVTLPSHTIYPEGSYEREEAYRRRCWAGEREFAFSQEMQRINFSQEMQHIRQLEEDADSKKEDAVKKN